MDTALVTASMGMGIGCVGLLSTIIKAPVVLGLEAAALACGRLGVAGKVVSRRLAVKDKKHGEIRVLALSKLNTIADTDLIDGEDSDHEVLNEVEKYNNLKGQIQTGAHAAVLANEETKNPVSDGAGTRPGHPS